MVELRNVGLAREIAKIHGLRLGRIVSVAGQGSVNRVYVLSSDTSRFVIRFAIDPLRQDEFEVEAWCLAQAAAYGIPSPRVVACGNLRKIPYLIQTFAEGAPGTKARSLASWRLMAEYARVVHTIPITDDAPDGLFSRFGRDLDEAWRAHLNYNLDQLVATDALIRLGVYPADQQTRLRSALTRLEDVELFFGLCHGDLSLRNLLVPRVGAPVLIDWGSASAGPVPYGDLVPLVKAHRVTGDPSTAELHAFAAGLGTPLEGISDTLEGLLLLAALDSVRWAIDQRPDRLDGIVASARAHIQHAPQF